MKNIILFLIAFLIAGCSIKTKNHYILYHKVVPAIKVNEINQTIGIKSIELPEYMMQKNIAVLKNGNQLHYLPNKLWAVNMDEQLTSRLITTLQKSLNTPKVSKYPWNTQNNADKIVQVVINRFIADEKNVILDATWNIIDTKTKNESSKLFSQKITIQSEEDIVNGMNKLFFRFETELVKHLSQL